LAVEEVMMLLMLLRLLFPTAVASHPSCDDGLKLDCAFLAAYEAHEKGPTAQTTRELKRLARRGHIGAEVLLLASAEQGSTLEERMKAAKRLADRGIPHGFERWGRALAESQDSPSKARELLEDAIVRGPKEALMMLGAVSLQSADFGQAEHRVWLSALVTSCLMGSDEACFRTAYLLWEPHSPHHDPALARLLAEHAVELGGPPEANVLLSQIILESQPDPSEVDRVVSLLGPPSEAGDPVAAAWLAEALATRGADDDRKRALELLSVAVRGGSHEAAQRFCLMILYGKLGETDPKLGSDTFELAMPLLRQHRPHLYYMCGGLERTNGEWVDIRLGTASAFDPLEAALEGARGGDLESIGVLAQQVGTHGAEAAVVADRAGFLRSVEESLCAVGTAGIPYYLFMVRALGGAMDPTTQAAWLFLVKDDRPWDREQPLAYGQVRQEIWAELSTADLIHAETRAVELRNEIASKIPDCALLK